MPTALLTGYSGFLGRYTLAALHDAGWQVVLAGRAAPVGERHAGYVPVELDRPETLAALRQLPPVDTVIHLACRVALAGATDAELLSPNVIATGFLADISRGWQSQMIFASTVVVHGVGQQAITAQSPPAPDTPYGRSKLLGEHLIAASETEHCILRMGGIFGRGGPTHLGLNRAIDGALQGHPPTVVGRGLARRNYLFVKDAAASILAAATHRATGAHLLAGPEVITMAAMLHQVCDVLNPGIRPEGRKGQEAHDQIIERSATFEGGVAFAAALRDIKEEAKGCA